MDAPERHDSSSRTSRRPPRPRRPRLRGPRQAGVARLANRSRRGSPCSCLVLLLAVVLAGGFVIRGLLTRNQRAYSPQEIEIRTWTARVKASPNDPQAHLGLGYAYQSDGRYDKALEQYEIVLKANPRDTAALYNQGTVYLKLGVDDRAEKSMWAVLDVEPTHVLAAKALGEYYARKGEFKSLIVAVKPAAEAHPELADLQYLLGLANEKLGDAAAASALLPGGDQVRAGLGRGARGTQASRGRQVSRRRTDTARRVDVRPQETVDLHRSARLPAFGCGALRHPDRARSRCSSGCCGPPTSRNGEGPSRRASSRCSRCTVPAAARSRTSTSR